MYHNMNQYGSKKKTLINHVFDYVFIKNSITQLDPNDTDTRNTRPLVSRLNYLL